MTKEELLQTLTYEELQKELKKRKAERKLQLEAERKAKKQCKKCKHYGTISYNGTQIETPIINLWTTCCCPYKPNKRSKKAKRYICLTGYEQACEHYEPKAQA